jgi:hypothetical protein
MGNSANYMDTCFNTGPWFCHAKMSYSFLTHHYTYQNTLSPSVTFALKRWEAF